MEYAVTKPFPSHKALLRSTLGLALFAVGAPLTDGAVRAADEDVAALWEDGDVEAQARYRFEFADQDGIARNATASTARLRLTLESGEYRRMTFLVEGEGTVILGSNNFNSTQNGQTLFPIVADPEHVELNRAQVTVDLHDRLDLTVGRQKIEFGNERFVGNFGFRQDDQTFDAIRLDAEPVERVRISIAGGNRVNTVFGSDNTPVPPPPSGSLTGGFVLSHLEADVTDQIKATAYGHWFSFDEIPGASSRTLGLRLDGDHDVGGGIVVGYTGEYAFQSDSGNNPVDFDVSYGRGEGRLKFLVGTLSGGVEILGGDGTVGFSTPLASLQQFNGAADVFLATPVNGLRDYFVGWTSELPGIGPVRQMRAEVALHKFGSENTSIDLGQELDAEVRARFNRHVGTALKFAKFSGGDPVAPPDTSRFWFTMDLRY